MNVGDTFFDPGRGIVDHLYVVVAKLDAGDILAFNITTHEDGCDETCVVDIGDHPFVKRKSVIAYAMGQAFAEADIERMIQSGRRKAHSPASPALVKRIQQGAVDCTRTKGDFKDALKAIGVQRSGLTVVTRPRRRLRP